MVNMTWDLFSQKIDLYIFLASKKEDTASTVQETVVLKVIAISQIARRILVIIHEKINDSFCMICVYIVIMIYVDPNALFMSVKYFSANLTS